MATGQGSLSSQNSDKRMYTLRCGHSVLYYTFGFKSGHSCSDCSFVLKESVN